MSIHHSITQVFENNIGNRITPELVVGMVRSLVDILAAGVQLQAEGTAQVMTAQGNAEIVAQDKEGQNGLV